MSVLRIVLFRFHGHFDVCANHLAVLRLFNPHVQVFGLYGGPEKHFAQASRLPLEHVWAIPIDDSYWKWVNGDLAVRWWYREVGAKLRFDILHLIEWDLLLLDNIAQRFRHVRDGVAVSYLAPLGSEADTWNWVAPVRGRWELQLLLDHVGKLCERRPRPMKCIFGAVAFSRAFLDRYAATDVPGLCNDEVRVPLFAQAFGMPVVDTGLAGSHYTASDTQLIGASEVLELYATGVSAFHPVKESVDEAAIRHIMAQRAVASELPR
jgi:hypothetical protein